MHMRYALDESEREFCARVTRAIFANPFGEERMLIDHELAGVAAGTDPKQAAQRAIEVVATKVEELRREGRADLPSTSEADRTLLTNCFLFHLFHRHHEAFDSHIQQQLTSGDQPGKLSFYPELVGDFLQLGFPDDEIDRYVAIFFQMRRAFHLIGGSLTGQSPSMQQFRSRLWNNVFTADIQLYVDSLWNRLEDFSTLLLGETGTGKGLAAAAIGRSGYIPFDRKRQCFRESFTRAFVDVHLAQFPESLIESELFGHAKGSFTGAVTDHAGVFTRSSSYGAVFLDEIGEVPVPVQIKLLRILQERTFSPVGSQRTQRFDGRIIGATNRDLDQLQVRGDFRSDFYYRLSSDIIVVPPLRLRLQEDQEDLGRLVQHLLKRITGPAGAQLKESVVAALDRDLPADYAWPGNVRELEQAIRRILLSGGYRPPEMAPQRVAAARLAEALTEGTTTAADLLGDYCTLLYQRYPTYQDVARRTGLDRRTVKKYLDRS